MKIFYIGDFTQEWNEEGIALAFERLGHEVVRYQEGAEGRVLDWIKRAKPDFLIWAKLKFISEKDAEEMIAYCKENRITTACWVWDLYFGLTRGHQVGKKQMFKGDFFFNPDGGHQENFDRAGVNNYTLRQAISKTYCYEGKYQEQYDYDVIFVGSENAQWKYREKMCMWLEDNYKFKRFGHRFGEKIYGHKLNNLYSSAKIVMGDSVYSPHYWSNRLYEVLGRGGFLIHPDIPGLSDEYTPYEHYIPYRMNDFKGLKEKIDHFLKKPAERAKISRSALYYTKDNHTLEQRCQKLLEFAM